MKKSMKLLGLGLCISIVSGCASVTTDSTQVVQVTTEDQNQQIVNDAQCTLKNERGEWSLNSQGSVSVHKSADNLLVNCKKEGMEDGIGTLISRANAGMWGNILLGGVVGAIIDHNKGNAYTYPTWVKIVMGENLAFDRDDQNDEQILAGATMTDKQLKEIETEKAESEKKAIEGQVAQNNQ